MDENNLSVAEINFFKQFQFEKKNFEYKINFLESRLTSLEENHELILSTLAESQRTIKSLENKLNLVRKDLKEKENIIDTSECYKEKILETIQNLSAELKSLKKILKQQNYIEDVETLKAKLSDLEKAFSHHAKEKSKLEFELTSMSEELLFHISNEGNLVKQIKKLESEKLELKADNKTVLHGNLEDKTKAIDIYERFLTTTPDWDSSASDLNSFEKDYEVHNKVLSLTPFNVVHKNVSLWKEILEVEKNSQKEIVREEMQDKKEGKSLLKKFDRNLNKFENCGCSYQDFELLAIYFPEVLNPLQKSFSSTEKDSKQCSTLTEAGYTNVTSKDLIQLNQPKSFRIVKTVSNASQTEFLENISPVFLPRLVQKNKLNEDVSKEETQYFFQNGEEVKKNYSIFLNHKNCDLDMDIYRSCRKLSVLPEEKIDDFFIKKNSLENSYSFKQDCLNSKGYFLEDINRAKYFKLKSKEIFSNNFLVKSNFFENDIGTFDNKFNASHFEETKLKLITNELLLSSKSSRNVFREPSSFDSLLGLLNNKNSLFRQIINPTPNDFCASVTKRRPVKKSEKGSLFKRTAGSTCRPLRLPCDKISEKNDEKMYKVHLNVPEHIYYIQTNLKKINSKSLATIKSNTNFNIMVSRFKIEIEKKINFHIFLEKKFLSQADHRNFTYLKATEMKNALFASSKDFKKCFCEALQSLHTVKLDIDFCDSNNELNHFCPFKKKRKTDAFFIKRLLIEKSQFSIKFYVPCIYFEPLSIIKNNFSANIDSNTINFSQDKLFFLHSYIPNLRTDLNLNKFIPGYVSECKELFEVGSFTLGGLSKSQMIVKNVTNFELINFLFSESNVYNEIVEEESSTFNSESNDEQDHAEKNINRDSFIENKNYGNLNEDSEFSDLSEDSESDTLAYKTVNTHLFPNSDIDSDTYISVWSDRSSILERKYSDVSEDFSSSYTTPSDTSSTSFCTPPDNYFPIISQKQ